MFHSKSDQRSDELNEWNEPINFFSDAEDSNLNSVAPEDDSLELSGPSQPEMTSFKSVGNDNMVDLLPGTFHTIFHYWMSVGIRLIYSTEVVLAWTRKQAG